MTTVKNKVQLIGRLREKPMISQEEGFPLRAELNVTTTETFVGLSGEKVTENQWHKVIAWGKLAAIAEKFLDNGQEVAIEGRLTNVTCMTSMNDFRCTVEVQASELLILTKK